ncbi:MAG: hypothetical protein SV375_10405 [Thermodesulfobacteriota bacterium]|nr:hypothetical protein [Thermodesulfobacteriota bacterium]
MSGLGTTLITIDVTERLSWELQVPLTFRPQDFKPFPVRTDWQGEWKKMKAVCLQWYANRWVDNHYAHLDKTVEEYNEVYLKPAKKILDELYEKGLLDKARFFDERPELD